MLWRSPSNDEAVLNLGTDPVAYVMFAEDGRVLATMAIDTPERDTFSTQKRINSQA